MGRRNHITRSKNSWKLSQWKARCPDFTFRTIKNSDFPDFIPDTLRKKYNCGYFASSGTTTIHNHEQAEFYIGFFVGLRVDKGELDEQPYVSVYNQKTEELIFDGFLQHGDYPNRSTALTDEQIQLINLSGITVSIHTERLPDISEGHLKLLAERKIITGLEVSAIEAMQRVRQL